MTYLQALEVVLPAIGNFKAPVRQALIPAISQYSVSLVGARNISRSPVFDEQEKMLETIKLNYRSSYIHQTPNPDSAKLPVAMERFAETGQSDVIPFHWGGEDLSSNASLRPLIKSVEPISEAFEPISDYIEWADGIIGEAGDLFNKISGGLLNEAKELMAIPGIKEITAVVDILKAIKDPPQTENIKPYPENPTNNSFVEHQIDWKSEQHSQWVRATYPYVDSYRAPLRKFMDDVLPNSCMRTYYTHWSNRFTIIECYLRRREDVFGNIANAKTKPGEDERSRGQLVIKEFEKRLGDPRSRFLSLVEGSDLDSEEDSSAKLVEIANQIRETSQWLRVTGGIQVMESLGFPARDWVNAADDAIRSAQDTGRNANFDADSALTETEFSQAVEAVALHQAIEELLDIAFDLDELIDFLDPTGPPSMFVMTGMEPDSKGNEAWTSNDRLAEKHFTIIVAAQRKPKPSSFGPGLFKNPFKKGTICFSQAIVYNANGRDIDDNANGLTQPNTGWDTLNWQPPIKAPEWRNGKPSESNSGGTGGRFPWQWKIPTNVFTGRKSIRSAEVKLNWQSMLVPITQSRLKDIVDDEKQDKEIRESAEFLFDRPDSMINH